jgi:capsular polysaccharide transport system permease protein
MKTEASLVRRLDEVRPGSSSRLPREVPSPQLPVRAPLSAPRNLKTVITYKVHDAVGKQGPQWGKYIFFFLAVLLPTIIGGVYYAMIASPQYVSEFRFSVRPNMGSGGSSTADTLLAMSNSYIVSDYVGSRDAVVALDRMVDLRSLYSQPSTDSVSRLGETASIEDLVDYWNSRIHTSYDLTTGINIIEISAFNPADAQKLALALKQLCEKLVNQISDDARKSQMEFAHSELQRAEDRLKEVRMQETELRTSQKSVDTRKEAEGRIQMNIKMRTELASLQSQYDSLSKYMDPKSPKLSVLKTQIVAAQDQINQLQQQMGGSGTGVNQNDDTLDAQALTKYDQLQTDVEISSKLYQSSLTAYENARAQANNNQIYLATYVQPGLPQLASYPRVFFDTFLVFISALGIWVVLTLVYYSIRDHV